MKPSRRLCGACLLSLLACLWTVEVEGESESCSTQLGMSPPSKPEIPVKGLAPRVCLSLKTCCTSLMETTLRRKSVSEMKTKVARKLDGSKESTRSLREDIKGYFQSIVQDGYQQSLLFVSNSHVNLSRAGGPLLATFFTEVENYIDDKNVNLTDAVMQFFRDSFPLLYQYASGRAEKLSNHYEKCLKDKINDIQPFGTHPNRIARNLIKVLKPIQVFIDSLAFAMTVIDGSKQLNFATGCEPVLLKMTYCSLCKGGKAGVKPCHGYCMDVLKNCLASSIQLQTHWGVYFASLDSLASSLSIAPSAKTVILSVYKDLSTAVVQVLSQVNTVKMKAVGFCGRPQYVRGGSLPGPSSVTKPNSSSQHLKTTIAAKMDSAKSKMTFLKTLYGGLPHAICVSEGFAAQKSDKTTVQSCWNGTAKASYTGPIKTLMPSFQTVPGDQRKIETLVSEMKGAIEVMKKYTYEDEGEGSAGSGESNVVTGSGCSNDDDEECVSGSGKNENTVDIKGDDNDVYFSETTPHPTGLSVIEEDGGGPVLSVKGSKGENGASSRDHGHTLLAIVTISLVLLLTK